MNAKSDGVKRERVAAARCISVLIAALVAANPRADESITSGRELAFASDKGNCLACHVIEGGTQMGNVGPPLQNLAGRYGSRERLKAQISDPQSLNENTLMPPFGRHKILTETEIDAIVEFLFTLQ